MGFWITSRIIWFQEEGVGASTSPHSSLAKDCVSEARLESWDSVISVVGWSANDTLQAVEWSRSLISEGAGATKKREKMKEKAEGNRRLCPLFVRYIASIGSTRERIWYDAPVNIDRSFTALNCWLVSRWKRRSFTNLEGDQISPFENLDYDRRLWKEAREAEHLLNVCF